MYNKGKVLSKLGHYDSAIQAYDEAIRINPQLVIRITPQLAEAWYNKGDVYDMPLVAYDKVIAAYDKVIELDPQNVEAWKNKGDALDNLGRYDEAKQAYDKVIAAYDKAIELDPNDTDTWYHRGNAFEGLGKYDEAVRSFNNAGDLGIEINIVAIGKDRYDSGEYAVAIKYYDEAIKQDPKDENAWIKKAAALRMLHRNKEAEAAYAKARELGYSGTMTLIEMIPK